MISSSKSKREAQDSRKVSLKKPDELEEYVKDLQRKLIELQFESQERERKRIGADLHDSLGSLLWGAKVNASYIHKSVTWNEQALASYNELTEILDESIDVVRRISWELSPDAFHSSGLSIAIQKLCQRYSKTNSEIVFQEQGRFFWNDDRALQVFRILQELLTNALKHSHANIITIKIEWNNRRLLAMVSDNGSGFQPNSQDRGVGLWNIHQRVLHLNGKINMEIPLDGHGTEIKLEIPLWKNRS